MAAHKALSRPLTKTGERMSEVKIKWGWNKCPGYKMTGVLPTLYKAKRFMGSILLFEMLWFCYYV